MGYFVNNLDEKPGFTSTPAELTRIYRAWEKIKRIPRSNSVVFIRFFPAI